MKKIKKEEVNWDKISVFTAIIIAFLTCIIYIADMKERIAKLEIKVEHLENKNGKN